MLGREGLIRSNLDNVAMAGASWNRVRATLAADGIELQINRCTSVVYGPFSSYIDTVICLSD